MEYNIFVILEKNYDIYNPKIHDLLNIHFKKHYCIKYLTFEETINFINTNNNNKIKIIFYFQNFPNFSNKILNFINNNIIKCSIFIFTFDFWVRGPDDFHKFILDVFKTNNYKVFTFAENIKQLNYYHNFDYNLYENNIIFNNIWCCYKSSFIEFNKNPFLKIFLSGAISNSYPERKKIIQYNNVIKYEYNKNHIKNDNDDYNKELNKYIACFSSSVYVISLSSNKLENTHTILQKTFEILSSGSLLVLPFIEEPYINKIGLFHNINCFLINFNNTKQDIQDQINYITNINNKKNIDNIRLNGQKYAKNNFNSELKFIEINNIIKNN